MERDPSGRVRARNTTLHPLNVFVNVAVVRGAKPSEQINNRTVVPNTRTGKKTNPSHQLPEADCGAETVRNFRLQFAYGVILLCGAACNNNPYRALWCEQEDDILAEIDENTFDVFQVKSRKPELGPWETTDDGFVSAIKVFVRLEREFSQFIRGFVFVSNTDLFDTEGEKRIHLSPVRLAIAVTEAGQPGGLNGSLKDAFSKLRDAAECTTEELWPVITKLKYAKAPHRESFIAELAGNHLSELSICACATVPRLKRAAFDLIAFVEEASSLASQDPSRHYAFLNTGRRNDPQLRAKRVSIDQFLSRLKEIIQPAFRYPRHVSNSARLHFDARMRRFVVKLSQGGLDHYIDTLRNQTNLAERTLLDLATRADGDAIIAHLKQMVKAECDYAYLRIDKAQEVFGEDLLSALLKSFETMVRSDPDKACRQPWEVLLGIAGMLTEDCEVWWSKRFEVEQG
jgi:hypothetical protein